MIKYLKYIGNKNDLNGDPEWLKEAEPNGRVLYFGRGGAWLEAGFNNIAFCHWKLGVTNYKRTDKEEFNKWTLARKLSK